MDSILPYLCSNRHAPWGATKHENHPHLPSPSKGEGYREGAICAGMTDREVVKFLTGASKSSKKRKE